MTIPKRKPGYLHREHYKGMKKHEKRALKKIPNNSAKLTSKVTSVASRAFGLPNLSRALEGYIEDGLLNRQEAKYILHKIFESNLTILEQIGMADPTFEKEFRQRNVKSIVDYIEKNSKGRKAKIKVNLRNGQIAIIEF